MTQDYFVFINSSTTSLLNRENVALWREIAILRQKHKVQQDILNNVCAFLFKFFEIENNPGL